MFRTLIFSLALLFSASASAAWINGTDCSTVYGATDCWVYDGELATHGDPIVDPLVTGKMEDVGYTTGLYALLKGGNEPLELFYIPTGEWTGYSEAIFGQIDVSYVRHYSVPEPGTLALLGLALLGMATIRKIS